MTASPARRTNSAAPARYKASASGTIWTSGVMGWFSPGCRAHGADGREPPAPDSLSISPRTSSPARGGGDRPAQLYIELLSKAHLRIHLHALVPDTLIGGTCGSRIRREPRCLVTYDHAHW